MKALRRQKLLAIARTDRTFTRTLLDGQPAWVGKCIHCQAHLAVAEEGPEIGGATIEHIVPQTHGGTDDLQNLALACARCNSLKGKRLDVRRADDPRRREVEAKLLERRRARYRDP